METAHRWMQAEDDKERTGSPLPVWMAVSVLGLALVVAAWIGWQLLTSLNDRLAAVEGANTRLTIEIERLKEDLRVRDAAAQGPAKTAQSAAEEPKAEPVAASTSSRTVPAEPPREQVNYIGRARERFEVQVGREAQIGPGIVLQIVRTSAQNGRFEGLLRLTGEGKTVPLQEVRTLQPVGILAGGQSKRYDLVVTAVTEDRVTGYLIFPR